MHSVPFSCTFRLVPVMCPRKDGFRVEISRICGIIQGFCVANPGIRGSQRKRADSDRGGVKVTSQNIKGYDKGREVEAARPWQGGGVQLKARTLTKNLGYKGSPIEAGDSQQSYIIEDGFLCSKSEVKFTFHPFIH